MNVVMTGSGKFVEVQATAEGQPFGGAELQDLLSLASAGIRRMTEYQSKLVQTDFRARARCRPLPVARGFLKPGEVARISRAGRTSGRLR